MASQARSAYGTLLKRGDGQVPETFTAIAEVRDLSRTGPKQEKIDVTNHNQAATSRVMEFIMGLIDPGDVEMTLSWIPGNAGHRGMWDDLHAATLRNYKIELADQSETESFAAYVMEIGRDFPVDDVLSAEVTLGVTGLSTLTP